MDRNILWYTEPAQRYEEATPVGNGRLGVMICGNILNEKLNLNEDTLWSGYPRTNTIDNAFYRYTRRIRQRIIKENDYDGAEDLADKLQGPYSESYLSAGELIIDFHNSGEITEYSRGLNLKDGIAFTKYSCGGVKYTREVFVSAPDDIIVIKLSSDKEKSINFSGTLKSMIRHKTYCKDECFILSGRAPRHIEPQYLESGFGNPQAIVYDEEWEEKKGLKFVSALKIENKGGNILLDDEHFSLKDADEAVIYLWLGTNYNHNRFSTGGDDCGSIENLDLIAISKNALDSAVKKGFNSILNRHIEDMNNYFGRAELELEYDKELDNLPTDKRIERYSSGKSDTGLEKLFFDFGRYLLYSCSRKNTQAANLQGIWCWHIRPRWSCNYTVNINTQMNYWGAESVNLSECHLPLIDLVEEVSYTGSQTAKSLYGARGFCVHHNIDLWRGALPIGMGQSDCKWSLFTMGGVWLSLHIWEHYVFSRDIEFLKKYYHILKEASLFAIDMMCELDNGYLGVCPTTVSERRFFKPDGTSFSVGAGSTFDYELITELFEDTRKAYVIVGDDDTPFLDEMKSVQDKFPPLPKLSDGTLTEWQFETEPEWYQWTNILFGLYPGNSLHNYDKNTLLRTLEKRDEPLACFSIAWSAGAWARLGKFDIAYNRIRYLISNALFISLLGSNAYTPGGTFQIDVNLGGIAAISEMLVQSSENKIVLLPALPIEWKNGSVKGIKTRCGCSVDILWQDGKAVDFELLSDFDNTVTVEINNKSFEVKLKAGEKFKWEENHV